MYQLLQLRAFCVSTHTLVNSPVTTRFVGRDNPTLSRLIQRYNDIVEPAWPETLSLPLNIGEAQTLSVQKFYGNLQAACSKRKAQRGPDAIIHCDAAAEEALKYIDQILDCSVSVRDTLISKLGADESKRTTVGIDVLCL